MAESDQLNTTIDKGPGTFLLPTALLLQDVVHIIDEQEDHLVLTVRIPIDVIRANVPTLMALCEIATRPPTEPEDGDLDDEE